MSHPRGRIGSRELYPLLSLAVFGVLLKPSVAAAPPHLRDLAGQAHVAGLQECKRLGYRTRRKAMLDDTVLRFEVDTK